MTTRAEPKPTRKDQTVAYISVREERVPVVAYEVKSSPHLVVHRQVRVGDDGKVETLGDAYGWVISTRKDGFKVASGYGILRETRKLAEAIGKKGNWEDADTVKETVPEDTLKAIGRIGTPSISLGTGAVDQRSDQERYKANLSAIKASGSGDPDPDDDDNEPPRPRSPQKKLDFYKLESGGRIRVKGSFSKLYPNPFGKVEKLPAAEAKDTESPWRVYEIGGQERPYASGATKEEAIINAYKHAIVQKNFDRSTRVVENIPGIGALDQGDQSNRTSQDDQGDLDATSEGIDSDDRVESDENEPAAEKSDYPEPKLKKGQVATHINNFRSGSGNESVPVAAYPVESSPYLAVHRPVESASTETGVRTATTGWTITHTSTGNTATPELPNLSLANAKRIAEAVGEKGDWETADSAMDTVPPEVIHAISRLVSGSDRGDVEGALKRIKEAEFRGFQIKEREERKARRAEAAESVDVDPGSDIDSDGEVEKDEKELVTAKSAVNQANASRLSLDFTPDQPELRDVHGNYLSKSEDLAEAVAEYKSNRDKTRLSDQEKKTLTMAGGSSGSDKRPPVARRGGRGQKNMR